MKVVVTGAGGQLGRELARTVGPSVDLHLLARPELDLLDRRALEEAVGKLRPDLVVNAAAYTDVDRAEVERERAFAVNADAVRSLAEVTASHGCRLIHISTDYVFSGDDIVPYAPEDEPSAQSVYGRSKRRGEVLALEATNGAALVVRTSWLYSRFGRNFVKTILARLRERDRVEVVTDQLGSPTWGKGAARAIWRAAERPELEGILHWSDAGVVSWYDFAVAIRDEAASVGLLSHAAEIEGIQLEDLPKPAPRPGFTALDCRSSAQALGFEPRPWRQALREMLIELREDAHA